MRFLFCPLIVIALLGGATSHALIHPDIPPNRKVDSYGNVSFKEEKARLDAFVAALKKDPHSQGYIVVYAGRRARPNEAAARGTRAKEYLVRKRGMDERMIVARDGGYREQLTVELFIVPSGGVPPFDTPTIDPGTVRIIGRGVKGKRARKKSRAAPNNGMHPTRDTLPLINL